MTRDPAPAIPPDSPEAPAAPLAPDLAASPREPAPTPGRWLAPTLAGLVLGAALQLQQPALWGAGVYAVLMGFGLLVGVLSRFLAIKSRATATAGWRAAAAWLLVALAAGGLAFGLAGARATRFAAQALDPALEGADLVVQGRISGLPQRVEGGVRFRLRVEAAWRAQGEGGQGGQGGQGGGPQAVTLPPLIDLGWYSGSAWSGATSATSAMGGGVAGGGVADPRAAASALTSLLAADGLLALRPGERWQLRVRLKAPHGTLNPHGFDLELWLWEQGVQAQGHVRAGPRDPAPQRLGDSWAHPVERARAAVREAIERRVSDPRVSGVLVALVAGDQAAIGRADWDVFRATGVAHLMSISGLHITGFAWLAAALLGVLWRRGARLCLWVPAPHAARVGGLALAAAYALFSGGGVPAQRTLWMLATVTALQLSGRRWPWPMTWGLAMTVVVTADPWALMEPGFWLSFVAVGVLIATDSGATQRGGAPTTGRFGSKILLQTWPRVRQLLREQGVVTLALTPLSLLLFGQASVVGLAANLLAIPWVTLVVTPLALAGVLWPPLWDAAAWTVQALLLPLQALAATPLAAVHRPMLPLWLGVAGVLGGVCAVLPLPWRLRALGLPLLIPMLVWTPPRPAVGDFELLAADIGQGNAVIVRTAGHTLLYDTGPRYSLESDAGHRVLVPLLQALDERLDLLVLSHRDSDHTGGAATVLAQQPQATLLASLEDAHPLWALRPPARATNLAAISAPATSAPAESAAAAAPAANDPPSPTGRCQAGQHWRWDGVDFDVLHPLPDDYAINGLPPNAMSCVLRVSNGRATALLVGDIERRQERRLVQDDRGRLRADVLLLPHHGSRTSSTPEFLDAVAAPVALIQAGYRNRYGHPAPPVMARLAEHGIRPVDSPACGAATWQSATPGAVRCERQARARYWHHRPGAGPLAPPLPATDSIPIN